MERRKNPWAVQSGMPARTCPSCGGKRHKGHSEVNGVYVCAKCGAVHGSCYLGDSYLIVSPISIPQNFVTSEMNTRYYDLECLGSKGITRRHGWYDTETKRIIQVG